MTMWYGNGMEGKWSLPNSRLCSSTGVKGMRNTTINFGHLAEI